MKWSEMRNMVGKFVVIKYFTSGSDSALGVFKIKNYENFPATYKVVISPTKLFKEVFPGDCDIYSMDLAGMLNEQNVFDNYQKARAYYNTIKE